MKFVILSSSRGTTMQAVLDALKNGSLTMNCLGLITDRLDRGCAQKAKAAGIPVFVLKMETNETRAKYCERLDNKILEIGADPKNTIIAALGWMWLLSSPFVKKWKKRILNVHPALLPKYPGAHAIADVLASGETETGMTIHWIDEGIDTGQIILQKICSIIPGDTEDSLKLRIQELEKEWYPKVMQMIEKNEL